MIADGITASNIGRGYVLRRLIRRVVRHGRLIGIEGEFTTQVAETVIALSETAYRMCANEKQLNCNVKNHFLKTLERGETTGRNFGAVKQQGTEQSTVAPLLCS